MTAEIFRFELRHHLRSPVLWLAALFFFLIAFGATTSDAVVIGGSVGAVDRNAPYVIMQFLLVMSVIGVFAAVAFVAGAVLRDEQYGTEEILYATPMTKRAYLLGRFGGAFTAAVLAVTPVALGIAVGSFMPWLDPERIGPFAPGAYLYGLTFLALPNLLLMSALFFALATATRSMLWTYVGVVALFVGYGVAGSLLGDIENEALAALLDPFGVAAFQVATKYWTTAERNSLILGFDGPILLNRALGVGLAGLVFWVTYARFRFTRSGTSGKPADASASDAVEAGGPGDARSGTGPAEGSRSGAAGRPRPGSASRAAVAAPPRSGAAPARQLLHQARLETVGVLKSIPFLILLALAVLNFVGASTTVDSLFGTAVWPVTHLMLQVIDGSFLLFAVILLTLYAGELVWREREEGLADVQDALPVPNWVYWGGKLLALAAIVGVVLLVALASAVAVQLFRGYTNLELDLYLVGLFAEVGIPFLLLAVLAFAAQVLVGNKYLGFGVMVLYFVALPVLGALDLEHNLIFYGTNSATPYSDLNAYGHLWTAASWFLGYWSFAALGLLVLVHLFWMRGRETGWRTRLRLARERMGTGSVVALSVALVGFVGSGAWIWYNTTVLNEYRTSDALQDFAQRYEETYKRYEGVPQPRITSVYSEVDIFPGERAVEIDGRYVLANVHDVPVDTLHLLLDPDMEIESLVVPGAERVMHDAEAGWHMWRFAESLAPGDSLVLTFELAKRTVGFTNEPEDLQLAYNGTFFNNARYFPTIGYSRQPELQDPNERRKRGLPPVERMPALEDPTGRERNYVTAASDWIDFETVVSTSEDQVPLAPGEKVREWVEDGRRHVHYRTTDPILGFWAYLSGDWEVTEDRWGDVSIDVYHHPDHAYNVDRMIDGVKRSLDYYTEAFGHYQHDYVRIVEFPRYSSFAQAFPGTIPFSESIGFIARLEGPDAIDYPFYVTAHEMAHQWWAHQVVGGFQQGATVLSETLSQYSALMVMEEEYGEEKMRRFLKYELDRYLRGRGAERIEELPLVRVENQGYIHYRKGSLVMYALKELVGEDAVNRALSRFLDATRFQGPPYPTSETLLSYLREEVPAGDEGLLHDLFRTITLYDLRAREATAEPTGDGLWRVTLRLDARKLRAGGGGEETEVALDDRVEVAVFGPEGEDTSAHGRVLLREWMRLTPADSVIEVVVDEEPVRAGVDPFNVLIDRNPEDNTVRVETEG